MSQTSYATSLTKSFAGALADSGLTDKVSVVSAESSAEIPFGVMVCKGADDEKAILPAAVDDLPLGIVIHGHGYSDVELGTTGLKPKASMSILRRGRIYVTVEEAVTKGDRAVVRFSGTGQAGAFRKTPVDGETLDVGGACVFVTSAGANALAVVEVDMTNE
jgi:hypothetical protein